MAQSNLFTCTVLAFAVALAGCGKKDKDGKAKKPDKTAKAPAVEEPKPPSPGDEYPGKIAVAGVGFMTPESVLYDSANHLYLVANINGAPLEADNNGFISKLSPEGKIVELKWIDGASDKVTLNAPKGLAIAEGVLYVADITTVRMFDLATGAPKGDVPIEGATFVNDLYSPAATKDAGEAAVYVTDTGVDKKFEPSGADAVYKIVKGKAEPVLKEKDLGGPNGVFADQDAVWVVTFRKNELFAVRAGKKADVAALPAGGLDGVVRLPGGDFLISSWAASAIYRGPAAGPFEIAIAGVDAPADIGYDSKRKRVLVPLFKQNAVEIYPID